MKMFYYTRKEKVEKPLVNGEPQPEEFKDYEDSFNIEYVIRSMELPTGERVVVLDDFHEETRQVPVLDKNRKFTGTRNEKATFCSEIKLSIEDSKTFVKVTKY